MKNHKLRIFHINDIHSRFEELAKIATGIEKYKDTNSILLDAGDNADFMRIETEGTQGEISSNRAFFGHDSLALGKADEVNNVVSLGDGGVATLTFSDSIYITNGLGNDFAVFENAFNNTFLELSFVEVSSDGENFFGFDSVSLTPTNKQVDGFGILGATQAAYVDPSTATTCRALGQGLIWKN